MAFLSAKASDFAPDLLTLQEEPPAQLPRALLYSVSALCVLLLVWACIAKLDVISTAEGRLVPITFTKVVQPAEAGVVADILIKEGDKVVAGQTLFKLDARLSGVDVESMQTDVTLKRLSLERIDAELTGTKMKSLTGKVAPDLLAKVEALFRARSVAYRDSVAQETAALNRANADLEASKQVLDKLQNTLPLVKQAADSFKALQKESYVSDLAANEKQREYLERDRDVKSQLSIVESLKAAVAQSQTKLVSLQSNYRSQLQTERVELLSTLNKSAGELDKSTIKKALLEIKAPSDGIVKDLAITTKGAVVAAGTLLTNIVPQNEALQAEVLLRNEDVGFIVPGQEARLKVAAYPFQRYGLLEGKVLLISADSADPKQATAAGQPPQLTYKALVKLDRATLRSEATKEDLSLTAGMLIVAEIHQRQRTVMEYLLSPIQKMTQEAARER